MKYPTGLTADQVPGPRAAHSCNIINHKMYCFGGWNGTTGLADLCCLDLDTFEWSIPIINNPTIAPSARNNHATFTYNDRLYIHGGHDGQRWLNDLWCYDPLDNTWTLVNVSGDLPSARACHTTTLLNRKVYLLGGYNGKQCFNDLDILDLETWSWIKPRISGIPPQARNAQTVTKVSNRLFLFGGHSGAKHLRDLHIFDTTTYTWSQPDVKGHIPPGLRGHTASLIGSKIFIFAGYDGRGRSSELYLLDVDTLIWSHPTFSNESTPVGRQRHTACVTDKKQLLVLGGFDGTNWRSDIHILDVSKLEENEITTHSVGHLLRDFSTLVNNTESFPDVTFMVQDTPIVAHKGILCARSQHFRAMFTSGYKESSLSIIHYPDWSKFAFLAMLEFLYTGSVKELSPQTAIDIMGLSDHFGLENLRSLASTTLMHSIDISTVCELLISAHRSGATELKVACLEFILKYHTTVDLSILKSEPELLLEVAQNSFRSRSSL